MRQYPEWPEALFVQMGDFVKAASDTARDCGFRRVILGRMVGKLTKIAPATFVTTPGVAIDRDLLAETAAEVGALASLYDSHPRCRNRALCCRKTRRTLA